VVLGSHEIGIRKESNVLFLAFYETELANADAAIAKRLEWDVAAPETFKILGEWVQHGSSDGIRGCVVFETDDPGDVQTLVLYYGTTVRFDVRPASDVKTALERARSQAE
jgi:hypothetical protein